MQVLEVRDVPDVLRVKALIASEKLVSHLFYVEDKKLSRVRQELHRHYQLITQCCSRANEGSSIS